MDGIDSLVKSTISNHGNPDVLKNLLLSCSEQRIFVKSSSTPGVINSTFNDVSKTYDALLLLHSYLPQCPQHILSTYGKSWIQHCLRAMKDAKSASLAFRVFRILVSSSSAIPELSKYMSSLAIPSMSEQIHQGIHPEACISALECLEHCMEKFNGPCGPHRRVIEQFLLSFFDYTGHQWPLILWAAASCLSLLPQLGGGGAGGVNYRNGWINQQKSICRTMHLTYDMLFEGRKEFEVPLVGGMLEEVNPLALPDLGTVDPMILTQKLTARIVAASTTLQAMLISEYPVPKNVSASAILNVICRGLAVDGLSLGANTTHSIALAIELPRIHFSLLKLLEALILSGGENLLPFSGMISQLVIQSLKWTLAPSNWPYGSERPHSSLRVQAYQVIEVWCDCVKLANNWSQFAPKIVDLAMIDINSKKDGISLSSVGSSSNPSNPRRSKNSGCTAESNTHKYDLLATNASANQEVCVAALSAIRSFILNAATDIHASVHKSLQETMIHLLLKISSRTGECPIPYSEPKPRIGLYRLLLQLIMSNHPILPPPTSIAIKLFSAGLNDQDREVAGFCGFALSCVEKVIHPAHPSLHLKLDMKEVVDAFACETVSLSLQDKEKTSNHEEPEPSQTDFITLRNKCIQHRSPGASSSGGVATRSEIPSIRLLSHSLPSSPSEPCGLKPITTSTSMKSNSSSQQASTPATESDSSETKNLNCSKQQVRDQIKSIDLTGSDKEEEDISEIPYEIDLADSDDDRRSISSQTTVNTPVLHRTNNTSGSARTRSHRVSSTATLASKDYDISQEDSLVADTPVTQPNFSYDEGKLDSDQSKSSDALLDAEKSQPSTSQSVLEKEVSSTEDAEDKEDKEEGGKRSAETEEESSPKRLRGEENCSIDDDAEEEAMLLAFVDVTREEEELEMNQEDGREEDD